MERTFQNRDAAGDARDSSQGALSVQPSAIGLPPGALLLCLCLSSLSSLPLHPLSLSQSPSLVADHPLVFWSIGPVPCIHPRPLPHPPPRPGPWALSLRIMPALCRLSPGPPSQRPWAAGSHPPPLASPSSFPFNLLPMFLPKSFSPIITPAGWLPLMQPGPQPGPSCGSRDLAQGPRPTPRQCPVVPQPICEAQRGLEKQVSYKARFSLPLPKTETRPGHHHPQYSRLPKPPQEPSGCLMHLWHSGSQAQPALCRPQITSDQTRSHSRSL